MAAVPTLTYLYVPQIIDVIWVPLRENKLHIRECGAEALAVCLEIIQQRDTQMRKQAYRKLYDEAQRGLKMNSIEALHGSLLCYNCLLGQTGKVGILFY